MLDPKPLLNTESGNDNYFHFVNPLSTHGVLFEVVSAYNMDEANNVSYDWSEVETYLVSAEINTPLYKSNQTVQFGIKTLGLLK